MNAGNSSTDRQQMSVTSELLKKLPAKPLWRGRAEERLFRFFCPSCAAERRIPMNPRPGKPIHYVQVGLCAAVFTLAAWPLFSWKGIVSFVPMWMVFEFYYRLRVRVHLHCSLCGFDPYLYLIDVKKARKAIEDHWRRKFAEKGIPFPGDPLPPQTESGDPARGSAEL